MGDETEAGNGATPHDLGKITDEEWAAAQRQVLEEDREHAYNLHSWIRDLNSSKEQLDGRNYDFSRLEGEITRLLDGCRTEQRAAVKDDIQAEVMRLSMTGFGGLYRRLRRALGLSVSPKNGISIDDVFNTVIQKKKGEREITTANLQGRVKAHDKKFQQYNTKRNEYNALVRQYMGAIELANARQEVLKKQLKDLGLDKSKLSAQIAKNPNPATQRKYHSNLMQTEEKEAELNTLQAELDSTYENLKDCDKKVDDYTRLAKTEYASKVISSRSERSARSDLDDIEQHEESGAAYGGVITSVRTIVESEKQSEELARVIEPLEVVQDEVLNALLGCQNVRDRRRSSSTTGMIHEDTQARNRQFYERMKRKYG